MFPNEHFKLTGKAALLAAISAAFAGEAAAAAGRVDFAIGDVKVTDAGNITRTLAKGAEVNQGDTINTNNGRAQIRFADGAYVSLQPDSQFKIDEYRYEGKAEGEEKGFFSLLKGAMRTITGAVGRINRGNYRVYTPSATIGIRGTEYLVKIGSSTTVFSSAGIVEMCNSGGCLLLYPGQAGYASDDKTQPVQTGGPPVVPAPPGPKDPELRLSDDPVNKFGQLVSGPGYAMVAAFFQSVSGPARVNPLAAELPFTLSGSEGGFFPISEDPASGFAAFDGASRMTSYSNSEAIINGGFAFGRTSVMSTGTFEDTFTDGIIGWGRWTSGLISVDGGEGRVSSAAIQNLHYVTGLPTPLADLNSLAERGVIGTYSFIGGTRPTGSDGGVGQFLGGTLTADFSGGEVGVDFRVAYAGDTYRTNGTIFGINRSRAHFNDIFFNTTVNGSSCSSGCSTGIEGLFIGRGAQRAGISYLIDNSDRNVQIGGAAGFAQTGTTSRPALVP